VVTIHVTYNAVSHVECFVLQIIIIIIIIFIIIPAIIIIITIIISYKRAYLRKHFFQHFKFIVDNNLCYFFNTSLIFLTPTSQEISPRFTESAALLPCPEERINGPDKSGM
jgi:hypothetical protein